MSDALYRVLVVHNAYQHHGGEDSVVKNEIALLRTHGHVVESYTRSNNEITGMSQTALLGQTLWSKRTEADIAALVKDFRPDLIHAHNTFPLISPSLYVAAERARVPMVQTLHNFRLTCLNAMFLLNGMVCEDCSGRMPWRGIARRCYHASAAQSAAVAGMLMLHRGLGTYRDKVTRYIVLTEFCCNKFIEGGLPPERIVVKPNFVDVPAGDEGARQGGLFVGRLSAEKGVHVLARAVDLLPGYSLSVIGSGQGEASLSSHPNIRLLGFQPRDRIFRHMQRAAYLVMPSICYETFSLAILEAFACGLPVIASRIGAMQELVEDGSTGLLFEPGSAEDLARKIVWAETNLEAMRQMGKRARSEYEAKYTPERNYQQLISIYMEAIAACGSAAKQRNGT